MPDASPTKWHLAHTTWFFETFVLRRMRRATAPSIPPTSISSTPTTKRSARAIRGRSAACSPVPASPRSWPIAGTCRTRWRRCSTAPTSDIDAIVELGLHHEQQHQELILMDAKHLLSLNPLKPAYRAAATCAGRGARRWRGATSKAGWSRSAMTAGLRLRQRRAAPSRLAGAVCARVAADELRRVSRLHRGWRLPAAGVLAVGGMGLRQPARLAGAALLGAGRRELARLHAVGPAAARSRRAGLPRQRLRGRRLRQVGGQAPAARGGVGSRLPRRSMTRASSGNGPPAPTSPIPAIASRPARSANTTASSWPTRWCCAAAARRRRPATCARPIATSSRPTRAGCSAAFASRRISDERLALASRPRRAG